MKAVLLAAGRGRRLGERTESEPKCMITVGPRRLIDYQLQCLEALHIRDIIVVVGYKADVLKHYIQAAFPRLVVSFVENPDFSTTNTAYSLWLAKDHIIDADFVYCNADVLFHAEILRRLLYSPEKNILAVQRTTTEDEEVKVMVQGSRIIAIGKDVPKEMAYGEFIGIGKFSKYAAPLFMEKLRQVINGQEGRMQYFEAALQMLCPLQKIAALDVTDLPSIEIDFPEDLQRAEQHIIHKIARNKKRRHRPRILFYAERNLHLPFLEPLHDYIAEHYDADLAFSAPPYRISQGGMTGCGLSKDDIQRLRAKSVFYENPLAFQADIAVVADACFYHVRHCKKIVNVGHGLICKGWFYTDDPVVRRENRADLICVPGQWHKEILEKNVSTPLVVTGFIKSDALFHCTQYDVKRFKEKYGIDEYTKTILFAPTFNEELSALPYVYDRIHELCDQHTVILIKLHGMTDKAWVDRYRSIATTTAGIKLIDDVHIACAMRCADVMVSDVSSIAAEFMLLDKPVVFFNNPRQKEYCRYRPGDIEYVIRDAGIQAATFDELKLGITLALQCPDLYRDKRRQYAAQLSLPVDGNCAQRAAEAIFELYRTPRTSSERFSILVQHFDNNHISLEKCVQQIHANNEAARIEIIGLGTGTPALQRNEINDWIECTELNRKALLRAFAKTTGDFIVIMRSDMLLPQNWLRWMRNYFRWFSDAGAVRALSHRDDYKSLLKSMTVLPQDAALQDIAEYLLCSLMGNSVPTQSLNLKQDCVMISRTVLQDIISDPLFHIHDAPIETIGEEMNRKGYSLWLAVEVLCYPAPFSDNRAVKQLSPHVVDAPPTVCRSITDESCQKAEEFITQALALRKEKNYRAAIEYLERAKKLFEVKGDVRSPRDDQLSCEKKDPPQKHERTHVEHTRMLYEEACFSKHRKDYHNAIEILEKAKAYIATSIPGGATMEQEKVVELQFDIYQQLGECYTHTGDIEKAREHFLVAQRLKPKSELPLVGLAIAIMQENRFNEAERLFRDALELNRHSDKAFAGLGLVLQRAGNPEESLAMYRKAMESNPTNLTALMGLVQTAYATNQLNIAIDYMKEYLLHFPANTEILYCLAGTYYKQEDYDKCREVLEQIFIFNPSHAEARNLLTMLDHVQGYTYAQCRTA